MNEQTLEIVKRATHIQVTRLRSEEASLLLLAAATALDNQWCEKDTKKLKDLAATFAKTAEENLNLERELAKCRKALEKIIRHPTCGSEIAMEVLELEAPCL